MREEFKKKFTCNGDGSNVGIDGMPCVIPHEPDFNWGIKVNDVEDFFLSKFDTLISEIEEEIKKDLANFGVKLAQNTDNTIDEFTVATQIGLIGEISPRISNILKDYKQDNNK